MRLFLAVNFDDATKHRIQAVQQRLHEAAQGEFSRPENLHLTLAFLGEVPVQRAATVRRAMDRTGVVPLNLTFDQIGFFRRDGGNIWWIGLAENPALLRLQQELCGNLIAEGFRLEERRFSPHITLARRVRLQQEVNRGTILGAPFDTSVDTISLMRSERPNGVLTYTEQYSVRAGRDEP